MYVSIHIKGKQRRKYYNQTFP